MSIKTTLLATLLLLAPLSAHASCTPGRDEFNAFFNENVNSPQFVFTCENARGMNTEACLDRLYNELWKVEILCMADPVLNQWLEEITVYNRHGQAQGWDMRKFNSAYVGALVNQLQYDIANDL